MTKAKSKRKPALRENNSKTKTRNSVKRTRGWNKPSSPQRNKSYIPYEGKYLLVENTFSPSDPHLHHAHRTVEGVCG